jgi:DNA-binding MarR family transcriptional regulator
MTRFVRSPRDDKHPYVCIPTKLLQDGSLSSTARSVIFYMLSMSDKWAFYEKQIAFALNSSPKTIRSAINELIEKGYVTRKGNHGTNKGYSYTIREYPKKKPVP